jgi:hypothetical protein
MKIPEMTWPSMIPRLLWGRSCPRCSSIEFQTAQGASMDVPLGVFALTPVRCSNCWRRYYCFARKGKS